LCTTYLDKTKAKSRDGKFKEPSTNHGLVHWFGFQQQSLKKKSKCSLLSEMIVRF
jgi:hypothetical protein